MDVLPQVGQETNSIPKRLSPANVRIFLVGLAHQVQDALGDLELPIRVAVMGCAVNGPGEAREADLGVAGGNGEGLIFKKGQIVCKVPEAELLPALLHEVEELKQSMQKE